MDQLLEYVQSEGRVCPRSDQWNQLYKMLPDTKRKGGGWDPPIPLILAAWWETSDSQKRERLEVHIKYVADKSALEKISSYLYKLSKDQWIYEGGV